MDGHPYGNIGTVLTFAIHHLGMAGTQSGKRDGNTEILTNKNNLSTDDCLLVWNSRSPGVQSIHREDGHMGYPSFATHMHKTTS